MDRSTPIILIAESYSKNEYGQLKPTKTERKVFAQVDSVTRAEFFEGGRNGLNPELVFRMFIGDYKDEREVEYNGKRYGVYRTYIGRNEVIELYTERKGGLNPTSTEGGSIATEEGSTT